MFLKIIEWLNERRKAKASRKRSELARKSLRVEALEERAMLATTSWNATGSGNAGFSSAGNWSGGVPPIDSPANIDTLNFNTGTTLLTNGNATNDIGVLSNINLNIIDRTALTFVISQDNAANGNATKRIDLVPNGQGIFFDSSAGPATIAADISVDNTTFVDRQGVITFTGRIFDTPGGANGGLTLAPGNLANVGVDVFEFQNTNNSFTGPLNIIRSGGRVATLRTTANTVLDGTPDTFIDNGALFDLNGNSQTTGSLNDFAGVTTGGLVHGSDTAAAGSPRLTLSFSSANAVPNATFSGQIINDQATALGLTKLGTGEQQLDGNNTYTGTTVIGTPLPNTIDGGRLEIQDGRPGSIVDSGRITSNTTIHNGELGGFGSLTFAGGFVTGVVSGTGAVQGSVTVNGVLGDDTARLSPGDAPTFPDYTARDAKSDAGVMQTQDLAFNGTDTAFDVNVDIALAGDAGGQFANPNFPGINPNIANIAGVIGESAVPGIDYDQVIVTGTVDLGSAELRLFNGGRIPQGGEVLTLIQNDGADPVVGVFTRDSGTPIQEFNTVRAFAINNTTGDPTTTQRPFEAVITYEGDFGPQGDGNDVQLIALGNPDIGVFGNNQLIADDDVNPRPEDFTDLGSADLVGDFEQVVLEIRNGTFSQDLNITNIQILDATGAAPSTDFFVQDLTVQDVQVPGTYPSATPNPAFAAPLEAGLLALPSTARLTVRFNPDDSNSTLGLRRAIVRITSNDPDAESVYDFTIEGTVDSTPEIDVRGGPGTPQTISIPDGDTTPIVADFTNYGAVAITGGTPITHTFTVANTQTADLILNPAPNPAPVVKILAGSDSEFSVFAQPLDTTLSATESTTFDVRFTPGATTGVKTATISIASNDADENPYTFLVRGEIVAASLDYGDAPDDGDPTTNSALDYNTLAITNGPSHTAVGPQLGPTRDSENNALQTVTATGDDNNNTGSADDEDGVIINGHNFLSPGKPATITVDVRGEPGRVDAWIDWDQDGVFEDKIVNSVTVLGIQTLPFLVPEDIENLSINNPDGNLFINTYARVRVSRGGNLDPTGTAPDGEVEDYPVTIGRVDFGDAPDTAVGTSQGNYETLGRNLTNTNFETGSLAPWTTFTLTDGTVSSPAIVSFNTTGNAVSSAVQLSAGKSASIGAPASGGGIAQSIELPEGDVSITANIAAFASTANAEGGLFQLLFDGAIIDTHDFGAMTAGETKTAMLSGNVGTLVGLPPVTEGTHQVQIQILRTLAPGPLQYIDNVQLYSSGAGPQHLILPRTSPILGSLIDSESDGKQNFNASGDDTDSDVRLFALPDDGSNKIVELDPTTGLETQRLPLAGNAPGPAGFSATSGLAFDGTNLWFLNNSDNTLYQLDPDTGALIDTDVIPGGSGNFDGLATVNGLLYVTDAVNNTIIEFNPSDDMVTRTITVAGRDLAGGIAGVAADPVDPIAYPDALIATTTTGDVIEINPSSGVVLRSFNPNTGTDDGVATLGGLILLGSGDGSNEINVFERVFDPVANPAGITKSVIALPVSPFSGANYDVGALAGDVPAFGNDDEDGFRILDVNQDGNVFNDLFAGHGAVAEYTVTNAPGRVHAWIDFDADGEFEESERITPTFEFPNSRGLLISAPGQTGRSVRFEVPQTAVIGNTFARVRVVTGNQNQDVPPTGAFLADGTTFAQGEVEDFLVTIHEAIDFGDAPDDRGLAPDDPAKDDLSDYNVKLSNDGPRHPILPTGPRLGANNDPEIDGQPSPDGLLDDNRHLPSNILLIDDQAGGFGGAAALLTAEGHTVTQLFNEFNDGYVHLKDGELLQNFDLVVYAERGLNGTGGLMPDDVRDSLENYIQTGGHLLVTGFDSVSSPQDPNLAQLLRVTAQTEAPGNTVDGVWTIDDDRTNPLLNSAVVPLINGPHGDVRGMSFTLAAPSTLSELDNFIAPTGNVLARASGGQERVVYTDISGAGGSVGYWVGGLSGVGTNAQPDFTDGTNSPPNPTDPAGLGALQTLFLNWAATTAPDDEDGVQFSSAATNGFTDAGAFYPGEEAFLQANVLFQDAAGVLRPTDPTGPNPLTGQVDAWADWDQDGSFESKIVNNQTIIADGDWRTFTSFIVPEDATSGTTFIRVRVSNGGNLLPDGFAADGEIEDYIVEVIGLDYGDAPDPSGVTSQDNYTTLFDNNGPRHGIRGPVLGNRVDSEADAFESFNALGDDNDSRPTLGTAVNFGVGVDPSSSVTGDLNDDGNLDVVVTNSNTDNVSILLGNGFGGFAAATFADVGDNPVSAALGDFNNDTFLDLVVANSASNNISLLFGNGAGGFGAATNINVGSDPRSVAVGQFNRNVDTNLDIVVANHGTNNVSLLLGDGVGGFAAPANFGVNSSSPVAMDVADVNGDANPDVLVANDNGLPAVDQLSVLLSDGNGSFGPASTVNIGNAPTSVAAGDINKDGNVDVAFSKLDDDTVGVVFGDGAGNFASLSNFTIPPDPVSIEVADFNGDGNLDIIGTGGDAATTNLFGNAIFFLPGDGAGSFDPFKTFAITDPGFINFGNFDADANLDVIMTDPVANSLVLLLDQGDDEDGVIVNDGNPLILGSQSVTIDISTTNSDGHVDGWIDWDQDGLFETAEQVLLSPPTQANTTQQFVFNVPLNAETGTTLARFRASTQGGLGPTGFVSDGEVEDYRLTVSADPNLLDFGDAPDDPANLNDYTTLVANDGPRHIIKGPILGSVVDDETDTIQSLANDALGDDNNNVPDDEDGVSFSVLSVSQQGSVTITVTGQDGRVDAWIDFDGDGVFDESKVIDNELVTMAAPKTFTFAVPSSAVQSPIPTFARVRVSTAGNLGPTGLADDGEVEDYRLFINPPPTLDFGDAPDTGLGTGGPGAGGTPFNYQTTLADDGPRHIAAGVPRLGGGGTDAEVDAQQSPDALGDDNLGTSDEAAGITFNAPHLIGQTSSATIIVTGTAGETYFVDGWIDFDQDGQFEIKVFDSEPFTMPGGGSRTRTLSFPVPNDSVVGPTFARLRVSSQGNLGPTGVLPLGVVPDGEVVDTTVTIQALDLADAPDVTTGNGAGDYDTLLLNNGPSHIIGGPRLGINVDSDLDGQPAADALGDDNDIFAADPQNPSPIDDDDGVAISGLVVGQSTGVANFTVTNADGRVDAWIDFNQNGIFGDDPLERIANGFLVPQNTTGSVTVSVPSSATAGTTFARVRVSTGGVGGPLGQATNGEVEDSQVNITGFDFGDAPTAVQSGFANNYPTTIADNGANHQIGGPRLGLNVDAEGDGQPGLGAIEDDNNKSPDEDGIQFQNNDIFFIGGTKAILATVNNNGTNARLDGWIDWNRDGLFDTNEKIIKNANIVGNGSTQSFNITVPSFAQVGQTYSRFRVSTTGNLPPTGFASDGEVEDYVLTIEALDFGDAPNSFGTLRATDGARHSAKNVLLGTTRDVETDAKNPSNTANGDDLSNTGAVDDEDGVVFSNLFRGQSGVANITVSGGSGFVNAWVDFNQNGSFSDPGEQIFTDLTVSSGVSLPFTFAIPPTVLTGDTHARIRLNTTGGLGPTGLADDGEVEDYLITIQEMDFGDAPDANLTNSKGNYDTSLTSNGPRHIITATGPILGNLVDFEGNALQSTNADGDDTAAPLVSYTSTSSEPTGNSPQAVAVGDFNNDMHSDMAATVDGTSQVQVFLGDGAGNFGASTAFAVGTNPRAITTGDINADDNLDLIVANFGSDNLSVLLGTGTGSFGAAVLFALGGGQGPSGVAVGDVNNDQNPDVLVANATTNNVSLLLGNGATLGAATTFATGAGSRSIALGDFNGDGRQDFATANFTDSNISLRLGNGLGGFAAAVNFPVGTNPRSIAIGDFNQDGSADVVTANGADDNISVRLGNGAGSFGAVTNFVVNDNPSALALADFDADGLSDIVVANENSNNVSLLFGDGTGGFGNATSFTSGQGAIALAVGELNSGGPDVAVVSNVDNAISLVLSGFDDEDGVSFNSTENPGKLTAGTLGRLLIDVNTADGFAHAWIDFNQNGLFEASEKVVNNVFVDDAAGVVQFPFSVSQDTAIGSTFARVRVVGLSDPLLLPTGLAPDGEVEDHLVQIAGTDFGDAPASYGPSDGTSGGEHKIGGPLLGTIVDAETVAHTSLDGTGDDVLDNTDDEEDNLVFFTNLFIGQTGRLSVTVDNPENPSSDAYITAWIDFDQNGSFDADEKVINAEFVVANAITQTLSGFPVPGNLADPSVVQLGATFARVRVRSDNASFTSANEVADDGEAEDYLVNIQSLDFGDAPDLAPGTAGPGSGVTAFDYETLFVDNGPRHIVNVTSPRMGIVDLEGDGQPSDNADGDDANDTNPPDTGANDEDGSSFNGVGANVLVVGQTDAQLAVTASVGSGSGTGYIQAWVDFNRDGDFTDANEQVVNQSVNLNQAPATFSIPFTVPVAATPGVTYGRVRISSTNPAGDPWGPTGGTAASSADLDGEVEDHRIVIGTLDFGDAPNSFGTSLASGNPARHQVDASHPILGKNRDSETDGQPNINANADDLTGGLDDEDGVIFRDSSGGSTLLLVAGLSASLDVEVSHPTPTGAGTTDARVYAWIDFNGDGVFNNNPDIVNGGEKVYDGIALDMQLSNNRTFQLPAFTVPGTTVLGNSYARVRLVAPSDIAIAGGSLPPTGFASTGEIEDYLITFQGFDYGDAPDLGAGTGAGDYQTLLGNNGPRHSIGGPRLGTLADAEADAFQSASAFGDDNDNLLDEDGVTFGNVFAGRIGFADITVTGVDGRVDAWIDFNGNGVFDNSIGSAEKIAGGALITAGTTQTFTFNVPSNAQIGDTFARVRVSTAGNLAPTGAAVDGEVEDYQITIEQLDFGDAPDISAGLGTGDYNTLEANNGPRHIIGGPRLGTLVDNEADGAASIGADGDDNFNTDDEDGATFSSLVAGQTSTVDISVTGTAGRVDAWIDFNQNGNFEGVEKIVNNIAVAAGATPTFVFSNPSTAVLGTTYARIRVSSIGNLPPNGLADDGEVEDYAVQIIGFDFGDAPDISSGVSTNDYQTLSSNNGPRHSIGGPRLGSLIDPETNGQQTPTADGDDISILDDEDGVVFLNLFAGLTATTDITVTGEDGQVDAWIDFNRNGSFTDVGEQIVINQTVLVGTTEAFQFNVPANAALASTLARVRVSRSGGLGPNGVAVDAEGGEVEDYLVTVQALDFGDAPDVSAGNGLGDYDTLLANNGPHHIIGGPVLGASVDFDIDGQSSATSNGDDADGQDDEDGVGFSPLFRGATGDIGVTVSSADGLIDAWIDFNQDGDFSDPGEQVVTGGSAPLGTSQNFNFPLPATAQIGNTVARIRVSSAGGLGPTGLAPDGEVEDYQVTIQALDFGDAPDTGPGTGALDYRTTLADDGARHAISGPRLGLNIDSEVDGLQSANAQGDDSSGTPDDEDGVTFSSLLASGTGTASVTVTGTSGEVDGWIDFNADGDFNDQGEQIIFSQAVTNGTTQNFNFPIPTGAIVGTTFSRIRVSSAGGLSPFGLASDGEVEDHRVQIQGFDFGDLPDTFGTTLASGGAFHTIGGPRLGNLTDAETDGNPSTDALADDTTGLPTTGGDILLIDDTNGGFGNLETVLSTAGHTVTQIVGEFGNSYLNLLNSSFLASFDFIVYAERGSGIGAVLPANVAASLDTYIQNGGHLLVTGYDSLGDPVDTNLATLVRAQNPDDQGSYNPNWQMANLNNGILNGPYGDFRGVSFAGSGYNDDQLQPGTVNTVSLATIPGVGSRVIFTDVGLPGSVGYWNGGLPGANTNAQPDFTDGGILQNVVLNWADFAAASSTFSDDEDGVTFANLVAGRSDGLANVTVTGATGRVDAWIDFDQSRTFEASERILGNVQVIAGTTQALSFAVPIDAKLGDTYARVRVSTGGNLGPKGQAFDGEIEDYHVAIKAIDFGDAPDLTAGSGPGDYATLRQSNGAGHVLGGPRLGALIDHETDGLASNNANGDDGNNLADEDGVTFNGTLINGLDASVDVSVQGADGRIDAWMDFNQDGIYDDATEQILNSQFISAGSTGTFGFTIPSSALAGPTFARFRVSSLGDLTSIGLAGDGEVEDYQVTIVQQAIDLGDAPDPAIGASQANYNTTAADNGPRHVLPQTPNVFLGTAVDSEPTARQNSNADGDDNDGAPDDEDGLVSPLSQLDVQHGASPTVDVRVTNTSGSVATLYGWVDFNGDGIFSNSTERGTVTVADGTVGSVVTVNFPTVPTGFIGNTFARFRISTDLAAQNPIGLALDGEVEDYPAVVRQAGLDFGDAPDPADGTGVLDYQTNESDNGARHLTGGPVLGTFVDIESFAFHSLAALGDDSVGTDDEDGVQFLTGIVPGATGTVEVTVSSAPGVLNAWIDFNRDGDWTDLNEQIITNQSLGVGSTNLVYSVPNNAIRSDTFARFRINGAGNLGPTGAALDGEVEDYRVTVGNTAVGVYRNGQFLRDTNYNSSYDGTAGGDSVTFFGAPSDVPIAGDWDGNGTANIGIYRSSTSTFYLDLNENGLFDNTVVDAAIPFGAVNDQPVIGDWNGDGIDDIGVRRGYIFLLDKNGNRQWDGGDVRSFYGATTDQGVSGDWNGDGIDDLGVRRPNTGQWFLDMNNNYVFDSGDAVRVFGASTDKAAPGDWNGDRKTDLGVFRDGFFIQDSNGNGVYDPLLDARFVFGAATDVPVTGNWFNSPLLAANGAIEASDPTTELTSVELIPIVSAAIDRWAGSGLSQSQVEMLRQVDVRITDLSGARLGEALGSTITLDVNAAGYGWFVDATPYDNSEFELITNGMLTAAGDGAGSRQMDLLTVVLHELGHVLGLGDDYEDVHSNKLMNGWLDTGIRRLPTDGDLAVLTLGEWTD